jgi:hypothetical protein
VIRVTFREFDDGLPFLTEVHASLALLVNGATRQVEAA